MLPLNLNCRVTSPRCVYLNLNDNSFFTLSPGKKKKDEKKAALNYLLHPKMLIGIESGAAVTILISALPYSPDGKSETP